MGDIAAVVLTESGYENCAYDVTGPEALGYHEVAAIFADALDRPITYPNPSLFEYATRTYRRGNSIGFVLLTCGIYTTARLGLADRVSEDSRRILGREPRDVREFVEAHADEFRPSE